MLELLDKWPQAIVGEIGIDRSAKVPGTSSSKASEHQWSLFKDQMDIAAQHNRPVLLLPLHLWSCDTPCIIPTWSAPRSRSNYAPRTCEADIAGRCRIWLQFLRQPVRLIKQLCIQLLHHACSNPSPHSSPVLPMVLTQVPVCPCTCSFEGDVVLVNGVAYDLEYSNLWRRQSSCSRLSFGMVWPTTDRT